MAADSSVSCAVSSCGSSSSSSGAQIRELLLVALDVERGVVQRAARLREIVLLALAQLARVLDRLLGAGDLRADLVVAACTPLTELALLRDGTRAAFR